MRITEGPEARTTGLAVSELWGMEMTHGSPGRGVGGPQVKETGGDYQSGQLETACGFSDQKKTRRVFSRGL